MRPYIGTKVVKAMPMNRGDYNTMRGWSLPADENGADDGYLTDNGAGHIQWQPKDVFEDGFAPFDGMDFGLAVAALRQGLKVARPGWNGKKMFLLLVNPVAAARDDEPGYVVVGGAPDDLGLRLLPWIGMKTADDCFIPWLASQTDVLAEDWQIV